MKNTSKYLEWYTNFNKLKYDFRASGISFFNQDIKIGRINFSENFDQGNPLTKKIIAQRYKVETKNIYVSSDGASGQNTRVIHLLSEEKIKKEAIVEYPTYEPLLRLAQEYFPNVKRIERIKDNGYKFDIENLRKIASKKTRVLIITNPHAPSSAILNKHELEEIIEIAHEYNFYILCDEIYAEFNRRIIPTLFLIDPEHSIVTTSFTKAYGLGGLKLGFTIAKADFIRKLYFDTLNTIGNSSNIVQLFTTQLLSKYYSELEKHKNKWNDLRKETEKWLEEKDLEYFPNRIGVTYWIKTNLKDTYRWTNNHTIPLYSLSVVPGAFFLIKNKKDIPISNMIRLGLGNIMPDNKRFFFESLEILEKSLNL